MTADWCSQVLKDTLALYPAPAIFNTDQGSQFTAEAFTTVLLEAGIQISMDGKGRAIDNIFVERLWRTVKYGGYLPEGLRRWLGIRGWLDGLLHVLQRPAIPSGAGLSNP
jgi:putative transposase